MKIRLKKTDKLHKSRSHLVKVAVMVNTKTGQHQSHRWINPNKAMGVLKEGIKGIKPTDEITFKDKETGRTLSEKKVMNEYQKDGHGKTIQQYVRDKYKVSRPKANKKPTKETNQVHRDTSEGAGTYRERFDNYQTESVVYPVLRPENFEYTNPELTDSETIFYTEENNFIPGETLQNLNLPKLKGEGAETAELIRDQAVDWLEDYMEEYINYYVWAVAEKRMEMQRIVTFLQRTTDPETYIKMYDSVKSLDDAKESLFMKMRIEVMDDEIDTDITFFSEEYTEWKTKQLRLDNDTKNSILADKLGTQNAFRPDALNGAKRNKPMTFEQANSGKPNPKYGKNDGYGKNCQSCVVVFEARLRGYDLETLPNLPGSGCKELSRKSMEAWINPETGENFTNRELSFEGRTAIQLYKKLDETIQIGERYIFGFPWKGRGNKGHIINVYKNEDGSLVLYDPQVNEFTIGEKLVKSYLRELKYDFTFMGRRMKEKHRLLRVDDKIIDPNWLERISQPSEIPTEGLVPDVDELDTEPEVDIYETLNNLIDENTIQELEQRLEPLYSKATGGRGGNKKANAISDIEHASQIVGIHLNNKPTSENKENLKLEMDRFYKLLESGSITLSQAIASQQFKNAAYLFILALLDEDTDEEISDLLDAIL